MVTKYRCLLSSLAPLLVQLEASAFHTVAQLQGIGHSSSLTLRANAYFLPTHISWQRILCTEASNFIDVGIFRPLKIAYREEVERLDHVVKN